MKRFVYLLAGLPVLLALACTTTVPSGSNAPSLKANQKQVFLIRVDGKTGDLTVDENGSEKTYARADNCKFYDTLQATVASGPGGVVKHDVILTLENKDGAWEVTKYEALY